MWKKTMLILISGVFVMIVLLFTGIYYYQATRFNAHVTINRTNVGGMTAEQALAKLETTVSKNVIYVGTTLILDAADTKMGFTGNDLSEVKKLLKKQWTLFPSSNAVDFRLNPSQATPGLTQEIEKELKNKLTTMNSGLQAPKDAAARWEDGRIVVTPSEDGQQYDIAGLVKEYEGQGDKSEVHLEPLYAQPIKADDPKISQEMNKLQEFLQRTVDYKVQDKIYAFKGSDIVKTASLDPNLKVQMEMDPDAVKKKLAEINDAQSTLHKNYTFTTHTGSVISVKGESYGWALDVDAESKRIQEAFEKGNAQILAYNVYGIGWNINGVGYHITTNHGIGDTYVEVSIKDQRIWVYKDGELKTATPVVTGTHIYKEDTPKGVWYIEYKESPSILKGSEVGNPNYSVKVDYWAPFTLDGCGFHDASWRTNWSSDAYIKQGSGGCVNTPPSIMKTVYDNLIQYEPVVIY